ncbi:MAG: C39 family peptidase [Lachnospiraceae bacterium]|nr:C39 family peptidase [Lachnospiraceae bacterium]
MANYTKRESKVAATGQRKRLCCKAGQKKVLVTRRNERATRKVPPNLLGRRRAYSFQKDTVNRKRKIHYRQKEKNKNTRENSTKQEYRREQTENYSNQAAKVKFVWKVKAGQKKIEKAKANSDKETKEKFQKLYSSPVYQQFYTEAGKIKERVRINIEKSQIPKGSFVKKVGKAVLRGTVKGTVKVAKGVAKETTKGSKEFIKADMQSQTGGKELLGSIENGKTLVRSTKTLAKIGIDTGKTMYRSGKRTAKYIAGVRGKNEYSGKGYQYNAGNRDMSPDKRDKNSKDRQAYRKRHKKRHEGVARKRIRKYMMNKFSSNREKNDSFGTVVKDILKSWITGIGKKIAGWAAKKLLLLFAGMIGSLVVTFMPVIIIVVMLYSPFALFFPHEGNEETLESVLDGYYTELISNIDSAANAEGFHKIQLRSYTGQVDINVSKSNFADVLCVFAEKYGYDLEIADVTKEVKEKLKKVFDDMNQYSVSDKTTTKTNKKGETIEKKTRTITITQKSWQDITETYQFDRDQKKELKELLAMAQEAGLAAEEDEAVYSAYTSGDTCIDGKVYDNSNAPIYKGICAADAKKTKKYIRPILKKKGMEPYIDIVVSMVQQESTFGETDNANWLQVNGYSGKAGIASVKAGIDHLEGLIKKCKAKKITDIKTLVQSYNFGEGYIGFVKENGGKDKATLQKKFQYKQRKDGRHGTAGYSDSVMSRVKGEKPKISSMPMYYQTDAKWGKCSFGSSTIARSGCGVCSLSMVVSYWTGKNIIPSQMVKNCHKYYVAGAGASWSMIPDISHKYGLTCKSLGTSKKDMVSELKKGHTIIAIMHKGYFTKGGHYIVLRSIDSKGNISVNDCGSRQRTARTYSADFIQSENVANYWSIYK